jgi:ketosteroid isomerase-like protein
MVLISMAVGFVATRFFGRDRPDADQDVQGDEPFVQAVFRAINGGEFDRLRDMLDDECEVYANGYRLVTQEKDRGPDVIVDTLRRYRQKLAKIRWELYDEVTGKDDGVKKTAFRFVSYADIDGEAHETEVAVFAVQEHGKVTEWRQVLDLALANKARAAAGFPLLG